MTQQWTVTKIDGTATNDASVIAQGFYVQGGQPIAVFANVRFANTPAQVAVHVKLTVTGKQSVGQLPVDIIKITIANPDAPVQPFVAGMPHDEGRVGLEKVIASGVSGPPSGPPVAGARGLTWAAKVTLEGPNNNANVGKIHVGFIQRGLFGAKRGFYTTVRKILASSLEQKGFLDLANGPGPWYGLRVGPPPVDPVFFNGSPQLLTKTIISRDTPTLGVPFTFEQRPQQSGDDVVDRIQAVVYFDLYIAAETTDMANSADQTYTEEARATRDGLLAASFSWQFDATGDVGQTFPYAWTGAHDQLHQAGVDPPMQWHILTSGLAVDSSGPIGNPLLATQTWIVLPLSP